jgi:FkbM family methyltransferase
MPYLKEDHPFYGSVQLFHHDEYVCDHIQKNLIWEHYMVVQFNMYYQEGNVIDIGAHIGLHSIALQKMIPSDRFVFSFEAHPAIYSLLEQNCSTRPNIRTYPRAVSDGTRPVVYVEQIDFDSKLIINSGGQGTMEQRVDPSNLPVSTTTIDEHDFRDVTLVKMDVEGHEMRALAGMKRLLTLQSPVLFIEIHPEDREDKMDFIRREYGYTPVEQISPIDFIFKKHI